MQVKIKGRSQTPLKKKARRGFRGYPVATVAFYGPDNTRATKVAVGIVPGEGAEAVKIWGHHNGFWKSVGKGSIPKYRTP